TAAEVAVIVARQMRAAERLESAMMKVNVPAVTFAELNGIAATRMGRRDYQDEIIERTDPRGGTYYWIGGAEPSHEAASGTDFEAIEQGRVSVTPLHRDITNHPAVGVVDAWDMRL
ncbi:MAG: 5'/3'-nucleotidase SurE, partial [bacterium]|nr:5'/3'-nucleotidase SurE [bacterium]